MSEAPRKFDVANQVAVRLQVPATGMVTEAVAGLMPLTALTVQTAVFVDTMVGATPAFVVADTWKDVGTAGLSGAPVKATVGVASAAVVVCVAEPAA